MDKILIIDDNSTHRLLCRIPLQRAGYAVIEAESAAQGLECILRDKPVCVLLDHYMAGGNGLTVLNELDKKNLNPPPVIFMSSSLAEKDKRNAHALGATKCVDQTALTAEMLVRAVGDAIHHQLSVAG